MSKLHFAPELGARTLCGQTIGLVNHDGHERLRLCSDVEGFAHYIARHASTVCRSCDRSFDPSLEGGDARRRR